MIGFWSPVNGMVLSPPSTTSRNSNRSNLVIALLLIRWNSVLSFWGSSKVYIGHASPNVRSLSRPQRALQESSSTPWCREALFDDSSSIVQTTECKSNLTSPRNWLEHHPDGVYTVFRGEWPKDSERMVAHVWGLDFHLDRLEYSFQKSCPESSSVDFCDARKRSLAILQKLLQEANAARTDEEELFMATLLWYPSTKMAISIRGHLLRRLVPDPAPPVISLTATLATTVTPNRYDSGLADCKLSSWCSIRQPLEAEFRNPNDSNPQEVIMTKPEEGELALLEGLTNNLFILYPEGVVRTAPTSYVLPGYARAMTISCLEQAGYIVDTDNSISINDAPMWKEVFVTSAIQLVAPVRQMRYQGECIWELVEANSETSLSSLMRTTILEQSSKWVEDLAIN